MSWGGESYRLKVRGLTLVELIVVVSIVAMLTVSLVAGYGRFATQSKVNASLQKINSVLNYARNLAIANNKVYHVHFENVDTDNRPFQGKPQLVLDEYGDPLDPPVYSISKPVSTISVYCFDTISNAMKVTESNTILHGTPVKWNPTGQFVLSYPDPDPTHPVGSLLSLVHDNVLTDRVALPEGIYYGIQHFNGDQPPYNKVIYFKPDGTASRPMTLFVTDDISLADDLAQANSDPVGYETVQQDRLALYNGTAQTRAGKASVVRMLQVYIGGMIKDLRSPLQMGGPTP